MDSAAPYAPATLQTLDNGMFALFFDVGLFDDVLDVPAAFAAIGEGNGYEWEAVLAPALATHDPAAFAAIEWDPEGDTFVAIARETGPLRALAAVLRDVTRSQAALEAAVAAHDPERG